MKTLKYLFITFVLFAAATHSHAAELPYLSNLRSEITNQLTIASNAIPVNKPLITKLKASLKTVDKNTTNTLAAGVKTLAVLAPSLNKTTLSNIFDGPLQTVVDIYTTEYLNAHSNLVAQLATAYPSKKQEAALKLLDKLAAAVSAANTNFNSNLAVKALTLASKNLVASSKAVTTAKNVPVPPSKVLATAPKTWAPSFKSIVAIAVPFPNNFFVINANGTSGTGFGTKIASLTVQLGTLVPGSNNVIIEANSSLYAVAKLGGENQAFNSTGGTAQANWNPATKTISGSFSFNVIQDGTSNTTVIKGTFVTSYP